MGCRCFGWWLYDRCSRFTRIVTKQVDIFVDWLCFRIRPLSSRRFLSRILWPSLLDHIHHRWTLPLSFEPGDELVKRSFHLCDGQDVSQIFVAWLMHVRSHDKQPPFPGLTLCTLLDVPATMKDSSLAPGFGMTLPCDANRLEAFSNIASSIGAGIVVIPLSSAVILKRDAGGSSSRSCRMELMTSFMLFIPAFLKSINFLVIWA